MQEEVDGPVEDPAVSFVDFDQYGRGRDRRGSLPGIARVVVTGAAAVGVVWCGVLLGRRV